LACARDLVTGVLNGAGRFVEVVPGDPVSQDDLVSRGGTVHAVSTLGTLLPGFSINLHSCLFSGTQQLSLQVTGRSSSACK
jgi:hypothetical protein